jgi:hypothetical protein
MQKLKDLKFKSNVAQLEQQIGVQETNYKIAFINKKNYPALRRIKRKIKDLEYSKQLLTEEFSNLIS